MDGIVSQAGRVDRAARSVPGGGQHPSGAGRADGCALRAAVGGEPTEVPCFDALVPPDGYRWWYVDALSADKRHGLTIIGFVGSVFSPYYAWARRRGPAPADNHCAINVALYGDGGHRWSMTERGRRAVSRDARHFVVGPSQMRWDDAALVIEIDEMTVPVPSRLRGTVRITPRRLFGHVETLDGEGQHHWRPVAPLADVDVRFESPALSWSGEAYHDMNWGEVPLERSFDDWTWSRSASRLGAHVTYDTVRRDGTRNAFALRFGSDGTVARDEVPPLRDLPRGFWRMARRAHSEGDARLVATLEDAPFYARSLVEAQFGGETVTAFHESLSLTKFSTPVVQAMLPFRMPRRA